MGQFTAQEKLECAEREAKMRREVYPRRNRGEALTQFQKRQIALMEEIAEDYRKQRSGDDADLFSKEVGTA